MKAVQPKPTNVPVSGPDPGPGLPHTVTKTDQQETDIRPIVTLVQSTALLSQGVLSRGDSSVIRKARQIRKQDKKNEARYCNIRKTTFQTLSCIIGAIEMMCGNGSLMIKFVIAVKKESEDISGSQKVQKEHKFPLWINCIDYGTFILLSCCGLTLLTASGVYRKESKFVALIHTTIAALTFFLLGLTTVLLAPHFEKRAYGFPSYTLFLYGSLMHGIPMILLLPAMYFSYGLYKAISIDDHQRNLRKDKNYKRGSSFLQDAVKTLVAPVSAADFPSE